MWASPHLSCVSPGAGVAVGLLAVGALELVRRRVGVRRDYESSALLARGAVRLNTDRAVLEAGEHGLPSDAVLAVFCA